MKISKGPVGRTALWGMSLLAGRPLRVLWDGPAWSRQAGTGQVVGQLHWSRQGALPRSPYFLCAFGRPSVDFK